MGIFYVFPRFPIFFLSFRQNFLYGGLILFTFAFDSTPANLPWQPGSGLSAREPPGGENLKLFK